MAIRMILERDGGCCPVDLSVTDAGVSWSFFHDGFRQVEEIKVQKLLAPRIQSEAGESRLIVQYVAITVYAANNKIEVRCAEIVFSSSYNDCVSVKTRIEELLQTKESHRPKRVLVFVNPKSGSGTADQDYHNIVDPLFRRCGVEVDKVVTKSANDASEVLDKYDLTSIDAVASMGGDGSYAQVTNGLIRRAMKDARADIHDPSVELVKPSLPFGAIPGGSACAMPLMTTGTVKDIESSVIVIVLGWTEPFDILGTRREGKCLGFSNLMVGCGVIIDAFNWLECIKWMGRWRYWLVLPRCWWTWRKFDVTVDYLPASDPEDNASGEPNSRASVVTDDRCTEGPWPGWKTVRCKASDLWITKGNVAEIGERVFYTRSYMRPLLKTGKVTLHLYTGDNFMEMMRAYRTMYGIDKTPKSYLRSIEVAKVRVRVLNDDGLGYSLIIDGVKEEIPNNTVFETTVHSGLLTALALNRDLVEPLLEEARKHS